MKSNLRNIKENLERQKNQIGLVGTCLNVQEVSGNSISASIGTDWREIDISYGKDLELVPDKQTQNYVSKKRIQDPKLKVGQDLIEHEAGHRENKVGERLGCPYNLESHEEIKDAVTRGLSEIDKQGLEDFVVNAFEDVLDNVNCRRHTDFSGQTLFWNNQGLVNSENNSFSPFYEAFVRVNLMLGSNVTDLTFLKRFFKNTAEVQKAIKEFTDDLKRYSGENNLVRLHQKPGFYRLFEPSDLDKRTEVWSNLAYSFALNLGKLLEDSPKEKMFGDSEEFPNNPFDEEMKVPTKRQEITFKRYSQGKEPASHRDAQEQLYDLYKRISKQISVETSEYSASQSMPLTGFGRRFLKEDETKFKFKGIGFKDSGEIGIKTSRHQLQYPVSYKVHPQKFPKFKLTLMDRSGSMGESPQGRNNIGNTTFIPWGDNSKYHFALKGYFGVDNYLERQGILPYVECSVLGYSGERALVGKSEKVAKSLLTEPSGGTSFDISGLESQLEEGALVLSISDGECYLSEDYKTRLGKKLESCDFAHIQIGGDTSFSQYLKETGVPVINVQGDDDLSKAMVSFVSSYYRKVPKDSGRNK